MAIGSRLTLAPRLGGTVASPITNISPITSITARPDIVDFVRNTGVAGQVLSPIRPDLLDPVRNIGVVGPIFTPTRPAPTPTPTPAPAPAPVPQAPAPAAPLPPLPLPTPPATSPFANLPFPNPGDRIRAEDFQTLSLSLRLLYETYVLGGSLFGMAFGEARTRLTSQGYQLARVLSVFGADLSPDDTALDARTVLLVQPLTLGERQVTVVLSEVATAPGPRTMPDLTRRYTFRQAQEALRAQLGDVPPGAPIAAPDLRGMTLAEAQSAIARLAGGV